MTSYMRTINIDTYKLHHHRNYGHWPLMQLTCLPRWNVSENTITRLCVALGVVCASRYIGTSHCLLMELHRMYIASG